MKYYININQAKLIQIAPSIKLTEAAVLYYLIDLCLSKNERIEKQRKGQFTWADYGQLIEGMPILHLTSRGAITQILKRLEILELIISLPINIAGTFKVKKHIALTEKTMNDLLGKDKVNEEFYEIFMADTDMDVGTASWLAAEAQFLADEGDKIKDSINDDKVIKKDKYILSIFQEWKRYKDL